MSAITAECCPPSERNGVRDRAEYACGAKQGDLKLHETAGGAFNPSSREMAEQITLVEIPEIFEGHARRLFLSPPLLDCMRVYRR